MRPEIDHIHMTVSDLLRAERFYDKLLPLLGFDLSRKERGTVPEHEYEVVEYNDPGFSLGLVNPRGAYLDERVSRRKPGAMHHLAFRAESRACVDELFEKVAAIPAEIVHPPRFYPEYCPDYYAFFFKDTEGMELEIVHFDRVGAWPTA